MGCARGCSLVQLRDKDSSKDVIYHKALEMASFVKDFEVPFLVNDYLDIAMLVDADAIN